MDPSKVRAARYEAGLSLAQLAGKDVSRTFLYFVEHGRSRPSPAVLALIAKRTGRPINYFMAPQSVQTPSIDLSTDLIAMANRIRRTMSQKKLSEAEHEGLKLLELAIRQGAQLARAIEERRPTSSKVTRIGALSGQTKRAS